MGEHSYVTVLYQSNVYHITLFVTNLCNVHIYNFYVYAIFNRCTLMNLFYLHMVMGTPPRSPMHSNGHLEATSKKTRQSTWLRRLTLRTLDQPKPIVNANPATRRASGPQNRSSTVILSS